MMTCKDISKQVSDSLDRELPLRLRMEMRIHLMMCGLCRNYRKQVLLMRKILHLGEKEFPADQPIPAPAAERIQKALDAALAESE